MTREEDIIKASVKWYANVYPDYNPSSAFCRGAEWADQHPQSPWISVEEDPKKSGTYFVMKDAYYVDVAQFDINNKEWFNCADSRNITHWMPIPELNV